LDAAILGIYDEQDTTRRYSRSKKDNTMIQSFCRITGEVIQEKYKWCICRWISCGKNTRYHTTDPKIRTQGAVHVRSWIATKHSDGSLETPESTTHRRERERHRALPSFRALVVR
jgi:hypothetical protein